MCGQKPAKKGKEDDDKCKTRIIKDDISKYETFRKELEDKMHCEDDILYNQAYFLVVLTFKLRYCNKCMPEGLQMEKYMVLFYILQDLNCVCDKSVTPKQKRIKMQTELLELMKFYKEFQ